MKALPVIIAMMIFFAGNTFSIQSWAQYNQYNQYNQYESQAGTPVLPPPRHHKPPPEAPVTDPGKSGNKVEKQPEYPGGTSQLFNFIRQNLKYPSKALKLKLEGKVYVGFTIKADGSVANVDAMRGIGAGCDEEAVRVVKLMPKWKPAENGGKPVDVSLVVPVIFKIDTLNFPK
jgi:protein TonB